MYYVLKYTFNEALTLTTWYCASLASEKIKYTYYLINLKGKIALLLLSLDGCHVTGYPVHQCFVS